MTFSQPENDWQLAAVTAVAGRVQCAVPHFSRSIRISRDFHSPSCGFRSGLMEEFSVIPRALTQGLGLSCEPEIARINLPMSTFGWWADSEYFKSSCTYIGVFISHLKKEITLDER